MKLCIDPIYEKNRQLVTDQPTEIDTQPVELEYSRIFYRMKN